MSDRHVKRVKRAQTPPCKPRYRMPPITLCLSDAAVHAASRLRCGCMLLASLPPQLLPHRPSTSLSLLISTPNAPHDPSPPSSALVRMSTLVALPTDDDLEAVDVPDAGSYLFGLAVESPSEFRAFMAARRGSWWGAPRQHVGRCIEHLLSYLARLVEGNVKGVGKQDGSVSKEEARNFSKLRGEGQSLVWAKRSDEAQSDGAARPAAGGGGGGGGGGKGVGSGGGGGSKAGAGVAGVAKGKWAVGARKNTRHGFAEVRTWAMNPCHAYTHYYTHTLTSHRWLYPHLFTLALPSHLLSRLRLMKSRVPSPLPIPPCWQAMRQVKSRLLASLRKVSAFASFDDDTLSRLRERMSEEPLRVLRRPRTIDSCFNETPEPALTFTT